MHGFLYPKYSLDFHGLRWLGSTKSGDWSTVRKIITQMKKLKLLLTRYLHAVSEDYVDEITDTYAGSSPPSKFAIVTGYAWADAPNGLPAGASCRKSRIFCKFLLTILKKMV